jgi:hypothetical protein
MRNQHRFYQKLFLPKFDSYSPQFSPYIISPVFLPQWTFSKKYFLTESMYFGVVFCADSEYHMDFNLKLIIIHYRLEIPAHFSAF